jgi:hypothetical protein
MVWVEFTEGRNDAAIEVLDDVVTDANREGLAHSEWAQCVDDALNEFMDADDNDLSVRPGGGLADVIQDGVQLIGVAGTEDCKHQRTDGIKAKEEYLVDQLVLDGGGIGISLLKIEVSAAERDGATLEAWVDDLVCNLLGGHCSDVCRTMISCKDICGTGAVGHIGRCLWNFDVIHRLEDSCANVHWAKQGSEVETELNAHVMNVLLAAIGQHSVDDGEKYGRIAGNGCVIDERAGTIVE